MFKIIVDSTADIPAEYLSKYDIDIVPLILNIDGKEYKDKVTITIGELYEKLQNGSVPVTSQPSPGDIYEAIMKAVTNGRDVIFITLSSTLSGTYQNVFLQASMIKEDDPQVKIAVIDSKGGAGIPALLALEAAKLREADIDFVQIVEILQDMACHCEHLFTINDLKYLIKSGRIKKTEALLGNLLHVKPILTVADGEIKLLEKVRGRNKALQTLVNLVEERSKNFPDQTIAVMHADDLEAALELKKHIIEQIGEKDVIIDIIGSTLGSYLGIGGVGVFFFNKKPKIYRGVHDEN